ncbi:MAG: hypothetical protein R2850_04100 [Bacteroidia bacterium]
MFKTIFFTCLMILSLQAFGQDQIFLRNGDGILDCFILDVNDSIITFRTLDKEDKNEYEIPFSDTYGFLLEDPKRIQDAEMIFQNELHFKHPKKRRGPVLKPGKAVIYKLKSDSLLLPRRGKMISLTFDSMQVEHKRRKEIERISIALEDVAAFGYTTTFTQMLTLIVLPTSALKDGSVQIYRRLSLKQGWVWKVMPPGEEALNQRKYRRKFRKGQLLNLPKSVRKRALRNQRGK